MVKLSPYRLANKLLDKMSLGFELLNNIEITKQKIEKLKSKTTSIYLRFQIMAERQANHGLRQANNLYNNVTLRLTDHMEHMTSLMEDFVKITNNKPTFRDLIEDLEALKTEFGEFYYDPKTEDIVVISDSINFEGIELGIFELRIPTSLNIEKIYVIAQEPNPSVEDVNVTHPHIKNNCVCYGDGEDAFYDAISQCRILDAFTILMNIVETYSEKNPYSNISNWYDEENDDYYLCNDCETEENIDDVCLCIKCDNRYCTNCILTCKGCEQYFCGFCINQSCTICKNKELCNDCANVCKQCGKIFCYDCMDDKKEKNCVNCQKNLDERLDTEIHAECVGQISLYEGCRSN